MTALPPHAPFRLGRLLRFARKELREILRDRRTILTLVLMPLLLYPLIGIAFRTFFPSNLTAGPAPQYVIAINSAPEWNVIYDVLSMGNRPLSKQAVEASPLAVH